MPKRRDDLISRQAAIEAVKKDIINDTDKSDLVKFSINAMLDISLKTVANRIKRLPAVDAVEVVRCKDCKYYVYGEDEEQYYCRQTGIGREEDFYCAYGERRTYEETIHKYHERRKEVLKEMSMPVGRNVMDALRERRSDG